MRFRDILLEYDRQVTVARYGARLRASLDASARWCFDDDFTTAYEISSVEKQPNASLTHLRTHLHKYYKNPEKWLPKAAPMIVAYLEKCDPSPNKEYVQWIAQKMCDGGITKTEDLRAKVTPWLAQHYALKTKGWFKRNPDMAQWADIGRFRTLSQLGEFILSLPENIESSNEARRQEEERIMTTEVKTVLDTPTCSVRIPLTWEAAKILGRNTQWCTSSRESDTYFRSYTSNAPLYVILDKKNNRRWQFYFGPRDDGAQLMDENDQSIEDFTGIPDEALNIELYLNDIKEMSVHQLEELTDWRGPGGRWDGVLNDIIAEKVAEENEMGGWH